MEFLLVHVLYQGLTPAEIDQIPAWRVDADLTCYFALQEQLKSK